MKNTLPRTTIALALLAAFAPVTHAADAIPQVIIVGTTPLPGIGQASEEIAAPVQGATSRDIARSGALDLGDFLNRRMGSVHVNEVTGNPFQMDVNYRGYTASPLLGNPQGISVYVDGVRMNQPFGDVVSWDLIPKSAISTIELMPGSNPLFGLNTLGGALSVRTKDGRHDAGTTAAATIGRFGRKALEFEHGGFNAQGWHWYVTGNRFKDDGWRDDSPTDVRQLFGKLGWEDRDTTMFMTLSHADNALTGNGLQEQRLLAADRASVYTKPDITDNRATMLNLSASHTLSDALQWSGNAYARRIATSTYNGDINDDALDQSVYQPSAAERAALLRAGYTGYPASGATAANTPFPRWRCIGQVLLVDEPAEKCNGVINRTSSTQKNYGLAGQLTWTTDGPQYRNVFVAGAGVDASRTDFGQSSQLGYVNPDRSITGVNAFGDGVTGGDVDGAPYDTRVDLQGRMHTWSVFATDTLSLQKNLHLTLSARYNKTDIKNRDQLHADNDPATLTGDHTFSRLNPAFGLAYSPSASLNTYFGYNESSRAPTAIELGCANPDQPCKLPNAMAGDPPLHQVVTRTVELGVRGGAARYQWNAGVFNAINRDDILFVADDQAGFGYFKNFGKTRRRGLELGLTGNLGKLTVGAHYTWLDATYQSRETVDGSSNSSNATAQAGDRGEEGTIAIAPGDRIPLTPRQLFKLYFDYALTPGLTMNGGIVATGSSSARGNENNQHQPDGTYYLGQGYSAGYVVANLGATWQLSPRWTVQGTVNNLFDTRYSTAAQLGAAAFDGNGNFVARPFAGNNDALRSSTFYAPGAPRLFAVSLRYTLGGKSFN
ncbi:MAG: TonB-dependent receptor [Pseudomonadota bacterium]|nr:TonB-dependent receptor [Pseudomonadota bacterium]